MHVKLNNIHEHPPYEYLEIVAFRIPTAQKAYILLWKLKDHNNLIIIRKDEIEVYLNMEKGKFKRDIMKLCSEQLLNIDETKKQYIIELIGYSVDEESDD